MKSRNSKLNESDRFLREAFVGLLSLKLRSGTTLDGLRDLVDECLRLVGEEYSKGGKQQGLDIHGLGSVLRSWHKETRYLAEDGTPLPLKLAGKGGLSGLIKNFYPTPKIPAVIAALKHAGLIKKSGNVTWLPTEAYARVSAQSQETLDHVAEGVSRILETVLNNINSTSKSNLLFEQSCKVRRLPRASATEFKMFVRQQAIAFLTAVDDWLEARVRKTDRTPATSKTCSAGVFTFAYIDRERPLTAQRRKTMGFREAK